MHAGNFLIDIRHNDIPEIQQQKLNFIIVVIFSLAFHFTNEQLSQCIYSSHTGNPKQYMNTCHSIYNIHSTHFKNMKHQTRLINGGKGVL